MANAFSQKQLGDCSFLTRIEYNLRFFRMIVAFFIVILSAQTVANKLFQTVFNRIDAAPTIECHPLETGLLYKSFVGITCELFSFE